MNILIIDDDETICNLLKTFLIYEKHNIFIDNIGDLNGINMDDIDIVICDIGLVEYDGKMIVKNIKEEYPNIKTILMSGYLVEDDYEKMKEYNVDMILPKPFSMLKLVNIVNNINS